MSGEKAELGTTGLRRDAIGLREVLFQSITAMAPAAAVAASVPSGAASVPSGAAFAGGSLPLSVLIALVACLFTASCVARVRAGAAYRGGPARLRLRLRAERARVACGTGGRVGMATGVVVLVLVRRHPGRMADTARVHLDDDPSLTALRQNGAVQR